MKISNEHKKSFSLLEDQHTFLADLGAKNQYMCLPSSTGLSLHVWVFDSCAACFFFDLV